MTIQQRFAAACAVQLADHPDGIGTLGEKTLHACIKRYFAPDLFCHETRLGRYVADVVSAEGIIEIQTRHFYMLKNKLAAFLEMGPVTVVYPVAAEKWLLWVDEQTGEITSRRKSPKRAQAYEILPELYALRDFLDHPGIRFCVMMLELEEYRRLNGWSENKKRGSTRYERIPVRLDSEVWIRDRDDYAALVPEGLETQFTAQQMGAAMHLRGRRAWQALQVLRKMGAVAYVGKRGRAYEYTRT